jgi:hypothetical protein
LAERENVKPTIDWNGGTVTNGNGSEEPVDDQAYTRWREDFVNHLGKDKAEREPNAGFRLIVPEVAAKVVAETARRIGSLFR